MAAAQWIAQKLQGDGVLINYYQSLPPSSLSIVPNAAPLPIVVFLHAMWLTGAYLTQDVSNLTASYTMILPDARCHGLTHNVPDGTFLQSQLVEDAALLLRHVGKGEPVFLMGTSMGASTAARVAKYHPELVKAVIIEEAPWTRMPGAPVDFATIDPATHGEMPDFVLTLQAMSDVELDAMDTDGGSLQWPAESMLKAWRSFDVEECYGTLSLVDAANNEAVSYILVPALLQMGDQEATGTQINGSKLDPAVAHAIIKTYPYGKLSFYEGGNHVLHEAPTAAKWLNEVHSFLGMYA